MFICYMNKNDAYDGDDNDVDVVVDDIQCI